MIVKAAPTRMTPADLLALSDAARFELVDGQLVERTVSVLSSLVEGLVYDCVLNHARNHEAGLVWPGTMGYQIFVDQPEKVRRPDVSFLAKERLSRDLLDGGYLTMAPDLAVEVLSPHDLVYEVEQKIEEYFSAGVRMVWIIHPDHRTVTVYRPDGQARKLHSQEMLDGADVLVGFRCRVSELFPSDEMLKALGLA